MRRWPPRPFTFRSPAQRLRGVLAMWKHAPDCTELPPSAYVFGNAIGEPIAKERAGDLWRATCAAARVTELHFMTCGGSLRVG